MWMSSLSRWRLLSVQLVPKTSAKWRFRPEHVPNIHTIGRIRDESTSFDTETWYFLFLKSDTSPVFRNATMPSLGLSRTFLLVFTAGASTASVVFLVTLAVYCTSFPVSLSALSFFLLLGGRLHSIWLVWLMITAINHYSYNLSA